MWVLRSILFLFIIAIHASCTQVFMTVFGMRNPKVYSEKQILSEAKKQHIPVDNLYVLDTGIIDFFTSLDTSDKKLKNIVKNHGQPCQALYYSRSGELISFHVNCYAKGIRSDWNAFNDFDVFPPSTAAPVDSIFTYSKLMEFIRPMRRDQKTISNGKYTSIVFFNRMLRARNRRLVKVVKHNASLADNDSLNIIYVNSDHFIYKWDGSFNID